MNLNEAQKICRDIDARYFKSSQLKWDDVYETVDDILSDLAKVYIPKSRTAPAHTFKGYQYIYSFAYYVQHNYTLTDRQLQQCKRLALEIKKAASICEYESL